MTKTPEQLAVEWLKEEYGDTSNWTYMGQEMSLDAFYAGYQAGRLNSEGVQAAKDYNEDTLLAAFKAGSQSGNNVMPGLSGYIPADFNDFLLSLPAKDQLADADKVMPQWISVKDRLPEKEDIGDIFLVWNAYDRDVSTVRWQPYGFDDVNDMYISHWMPLPEIPEDKGKAHWQELREFWKARNVTISEWQEDK